jgi:MFS family permease
LLGGLGVGGMFGAATTLVAESVPANFRTAALGSMQALSAFGNITGAALSLGITPGRENFWGAYSGWQVLFFASVFPIFLVVPIVFVLKESEPWKKAKAEAAAGGAGKSVGSTLELFTNPRWRRSTIVGVCLGLSGMVGLWGIAFFSPELITTALKDRPLQAHELTQSGEICRALKAPPNAAVAHLKSLMEPAVVRLVEKVGPSEPVPAATSAALLGELNRLVQEKEIYRAEAFAGVRLSKAAAKQIQLVEKTGQKAEIVFLNRLLLEQTFPGEIAGLQKTIDTMRGRGMMLQDVGSLLGMFTFTFVAAYFSRRGAFLGAFLLCLGTVSSVFLCLKTEAHVYWMLPLLGFATQAVSAGYSIYFPEIFPTRLRGTGVGFCYNAVRFLAAPFPFFLGWMSSILPFRTVALIMSSIYLVGIVTLIWAPETKGKPLPED